jgi:uncharacterized protein
LRTPEPDARTRRIIERLGLVPHPEGGFYRETFRSDRVLDGTKQHASTAIYFLLPAGVFSAFHVIRGADEIWHHYAGDTVEIHTIAPGGEHRVEILGAGVEEGERPQLVVPAGTLQAAIPRGDAFALCGCTVSPGFDFADFELPARDDLLRRFPRHGEVIRRLTRA